jgi:hypothetical protein
MDFGMLNRIKKPQSLRRTLQRASILQKRRIAGWYLKQRP